jgi:hypothetical protein
MRSKYLRKYYDGGALGVSPPIVLQEPSNSTLKLSCDGDGSSWVWTVLPSVPYAVSSYGGVVAVGTKLYLAGLSVAAVRSGRGPLCAPLHGLTGAGFLAGG